MAAKKSKPSPKSSCFEARIASGDEDEEPEVPGEPSEDRFEATLAAGTPSCAGCSQPMIPLAILHAHPDRLPLAKHEALGVFVCRRNEAGDDFDAWWASCALGNQPAAKGGLVTRLFDEAPAIEAGKAVSYARRQDKDEDEEGDDGKPLPLAGTKLGGAPRWSSATDPFKAPKCAVCKKTAQFIGQITSDMSLEFDAGDGFNLWLYLCPEEHEARAIAFVE